MAREEPLSITTVARILSDARCLFNWAEDAGLIELLESHRVTPEAHP